MTSLQILDITFELWGAFICMVAAATVLIPGYKTEAEMRLCNMELANAFLLLADSLAWYFRGDLSQAGYIIVRISNYASFALCYVLILTYFKYLNCFLNQESVLAKIAKYCTYSIVAIEAILLALNPFLHQLFYFDVLNLYHRSSQHAVAMILGGVLIIVYTVVAIADRKSMSRLRYYSFLSFMAFPFVAIIVQTLVYGVSLTYIAYTMSIVLFFVVTQLEKTEYLVQQERDMNDMRTKVLLSQIQPHFLFNVLSSIYYLCVKDPERAQQAVGDFSKFLRANLDSLKEIAPIPFEQEMNYVDCYLDLEKLRHADQIEIIRDLQVTDFKVPALAIQPLVENAVKYGATKSEEPVGKVWISTGYNTNGDVVLTIRDNGQGYDFSKPHPDGRTHVGIENVRYRWKDMMHAELELESIIGRGTTAKVVIPKEHIQLIELVEDDTTLREEVSTRG